MNNSEYSDSLFSSKLTAIKISYLEKENKELKRRLADLENNLFIKEKDELYNEIKALTEKNKLLERKNNNLLDAVQSLESTSQKNIELKKLLLYHHNKLKSFKKELNYYRNKEKKAKKKKDVIYEILELREKGLTYKEIAKKYGVSASTIHYRINNSKKNK